MSSFTVSEGLPMSATLQTASRGADRCVQTVVICRDADVIARPIRAFEREDFVFDPLR
jgi:hypothetical protein